MLRLSKGGGQSKQLQSSCRAVLQIAEQCCKAVAEQCCRAVAEQLQISCRAVAEVKRGAEQLQM